MDPKSVNPRTHFHIHWNAVKSMDAEIFDTLPEAVLCAARLQLANLSETITIEEVSENCPICRPKVAWVN
jgi:hypothetical protein